MNPHFFTAPFTLLSFGSGFRWRLRHLFYWAMLESGILVMGYQS